MKKTFTSLGINILIACLLLLVLPEVVLTIVMLLCTGHVIAKLSDLITDKLLGETNGNN